MGTFRSTSDQKNAKKKNEHSAAFIARQQTGGILSHVRRTLVWGLKITNKIHRNRAGPTASASEGCGTKNAKRWGCFWGCPEDSYPISTLAHKHSAKELILWPPSGGPPHTAVVAMWGGNRTRREEGFCLP